MKKIACILAALLLLCSHALAYGSVSVGGLNFKYLSNASDRPSASVTVKGRVTADQIMKTINAGGTYGINYKLTYSGKGTQSMEARIVFSAPDGWSFTYRSSLSFSDEVRYVWFECLGQDFFPIYYSQFGIIEPGDYSISLYLNDALTDTSTFTVD